MPRFPLLALLLAACASAPAPAPAPAAPPPASTEAPRETVLPHETFTLESKALGETRRINVYTPPSYTKDRGARFPVLYMPDGGVEEDFPHVVLALDSAIKSFEVRPMIVVGIENTQRRRDMTGPTQVSSDEKIAPHVGGSAEFRAFLRDELMPAIATRVRENGERAIIGESLAGLFIVETFLVAPEMFQTYIALSPSLWWNDRAIPRGYAAWRKAHPTAKGTLYFAVASDDDRDDAIAQFAAALKSDPPPGLTWFFEPMPQEKHSTIYRGAEGHVLRKLFPASR